MWEARWKHRRLNSFIYSTHEGQSFLHSTDRDYRQTLLQSLIHETRSARSFPQPSSAFLSQSRMSPLDDQTHPNRSSRPVPHRLHSLQTIHSHSTPSPPFGVQTTPTDYAYALGSSSGPKRQRPGAPSRSHSFCGDSSASTYALASASAGGHLSMDKRILVAPPLERTISSLGLRGNVASAHTTMTKPLGREVVRPREAALAVSAIAMSQRTLLTLVSRQHLLHPLCACCNPCQYRKSQSHNSQHPRDHRSVRSSVLLLARRRPDLRLLRSEACPRHQ